MNFEEQLDAMLDSGIKTIILTADGESTGLEDFMRRYAQSHGAAAWFPWYPERMPDFSMQNPGRIRPSLQRVFDEEGEGRPGQLFLRFCEQSLDDLAARLHVDQGELIRAVLLPLEEKQAAQAPLTEEEAALWSEIEAWKQVRYFFCIDRLPENAAEVFGPVLRCLDERRRGVTHRVLAEDCEGFGTDKYFDEGFFVPENICVLFVSNDRSYLPHRSGITLPDCFRKVKAEKAQDYALLLEMYLRENYAASGLPDAAGDAKLLGKAVKRINGLFSELPWQHRPRLVPGLFRDLGRPIGGKPLTVAALWLTLRKYLVPKLVSDTCGSSRTETVGTIPGYCIREFNAVVGDRPDLRIPEDRL